MLIHLGSSEPEYGEAGPNRLMTLSRYAHTAEDQEAAAQHIEPWEQRMRLARGYLAVGRPNDALRPARDAVEMAPNEAWAHTVYAASLLLLGRVPPAMTGARKAARLAETSPEVYPVLAEVFNRLNQPVASFDAVEQGLRYTPTDEDLLVLKGWAEKRMDRPRVALRTAQDGLTLHPISSALRNLTGCVHYEQAERLLRPGRRSVIHRRAEDAFLDAVQHGPEERYVRRNRRRNLISWRKNLLLWLFVPLLASAVILGMVVGFAVGGTPTPRMLSGLVAVGLMAGSAAPIVFSDAHPGGWVEGFVLRAPFRRFGVPTLPVSPGLGRVAGVLWAGAWLSLLAPTAAVLAVVYLPPLLGLR